MVVLFQLYVDACYDSAENAVGRRQARASATKPNRGCRGTDETAPKVIPSVVLATGVGSKTSTQTAEYKDDGDGRRGKDIIQSNILSAHAESEISISNSFVPVAGKSSRKTPDIAEEALGFQ